ncbi:hypothetical protein [Pilimelia columellifera]|uniref:Uncharacterized protein n=1 Tax=Pilimelia columellifera subsp. columellifera TaxID=706583 RepID=A0ABP6AM50_9ACTN
MDDSSGLWADPHDAHAPRPRPTYREPHPVTVHAAVAGVAFGVLWLLGWALVAADVIGLSVAGQAIAQALAGVVAWACAVLLACRGDRGAAVGVALGITFGWALTGLALVAQSW